MKKFEIKNYTTFEIDKNFDNKIGYDLWKLLIKFETRSKLYTLSFLNSKMTQIIRPYRNKETIYVCNMYT